MDKPLHVRLLCLHNPKIPQLQYSQLIFCYDFLGFAANLVIYSKCLENIPEKIITHRPVCRKLQNKRVIREQHTTPHHIILFLRKSCYLWDL